MNRALAARRQHVLPAGVILALAAAVCWLSATREPADAFLFPRLIGGAMLLLAAWNFGRAVLGPARAGAGFDAATLGRIAPGVVVMLVLVLFAARALGFYPAAFLAFLAIHSLHDPAPHAAARTWLRRVGVATGFMLVVFVLFTLLLRVQVPRGVLP